MSGWPSCVKTQHITLFPRSSHSCSSSATFTHHTWWSCPTYFVSPQKFFCLLEGRRRRRWRFYCLQLECATNRWPAQCEASSCLEGPHVFLNPFFKWTSGTERRDRCTEDKARSAAWPSPKSSVCSSSAARRGSGYMMCSSWHSFLAERRDGCNGGIRR